MSLQNAVKRIPAKSLWNHSILYVDRSVIVINKPPGLVCQLDTKERDDVNPVEKNEFNELLNNLQKKLSLPNPPYPVHRLDKGTTGALIFGRSASSTQQLSLQFQQGSVEKTYYALVRGGKKSFTSSSGQIRAPIGYWDGRAQVHVKGKPSSTDWELVGSSPTAPVSLMKLNLITGNKHQLRVHLAHCLNTPILGDTLHSKSETSSAIMNATKIPENRMFLHASRISLFRYRTSGPHKRFRLSVRAPLPKDFLSICRDLKIDVDHQESRGGLFVDGKPVKDGLIPEVEGYWVT